MSSFRILFGDVNCKDWRGRLQLDQPVNNTHRVARARILRVGTTKRRRVAATSSKEASPGQHPAMVLCAEPIALSAFSAERAMVEGLLTSASSAVTLARLKLSIQAYVPVVSDCRSFESSTRLVWHHRRRTKSRRRAGAPTFTCPLPRPECAPGLPDRPVASGCAAR